MYDTFNETLMLGEKNTLQLFVARLNLLEVPP